jgi:hypothetical protein
MFINRHAFTINFFSKRTKTFNFPLPSPSKFFSEKFYKVTFSGVDKFISNEDFKNILDQINEVKVHRSNKSTNKNYAHVDLSSTLSITNLREKFESIKIMGKAVKVRVKELDEETKELLNKSYNNFDLFQLSNENKEESLDYVQQYIKMFYLKNLSDNPHQIKSLLDQVENNSVMIYDYNRELFEFEYKLQILKDFDDRRFSRKDLFNNPTYLAIRNFSNFTEKPNEIIKKIHQIFEKIFEKLGYPSYDLMNNKGVYRNLQIKFLNNTDSKYQFMVTLMLSMSELSQIDLKILTEAIKYEFKLYDIIFYLSINEKVQSLVQNSSVFYHIMEDRAYLEYKNQKNQKNEKIEKNENFSQKNEIKIFPISSDTLPLYFSQINLKEILELDNDHFTNVYELDFSLNYVPITTLLNIHVKNKIYFLRNKIDFGMYDMQTREDLLEGKKLFSSDCENLEVVGGFDDYVKCINKDSVTDEGNKNINNNLLIINLRDLSTKKFKFDKVRDKAKYHIIISHSFLQILDFLKNYQEMPKLKKIIFVKDSQFEFKEIVLILEK